MTRDLVMLNLEQIWVEDDDDDMEVRARTSSYSIPGCRSLG